MRRSHVVLAVACGAISLACFSAVVMREHGRSQPTSKVDDPPPPPPSEADAASPEDAAPAPPPEPEKVSECKATVLVYHHIQAHFASEGPVARSLNVPPNALDKQLDYLEAHGYNVISYGRLVDCMRTGNNVPEKAVVLTFDDGWKTQHVNAFPLLKRHKMTATFFVTTATQGPALMTWKDMKELDAAGMTIASHTRTHPMLSRSMQEKRLVYELTDSRKAIKDNIGKEPDFLAYPYGGFDKTVQDKTKEAGYVAARTVMRGNVHKKDDLYAMKAEAVPENIQAFAKLLER